MSEGYNWRRFLFITFLLAVLVLCGCTLQSKAPAKSKPPSVSSGSGCSWQVYFSPNGGCTDAIIRTLNGAKTSVLVQAYSFTSAPIAKALLNAQKRGVGIKVILDDSNVTAKYSAADFLRNSGIPTWIDSKHAIAHNKIMIIDGATVITGSFNFTKAAEQRNAENLLILKDRALAARYTKNWQDHLAHSQRYGQKKQSR